MKKLKTLFAAGLLAVSTVVFSASYAPTSTDTFEDILTAMGLTQSEFEALYGSNYTWVVGDTLYDNYLDILSNLPDASTDDINDFINTVPVALQTDIDTFITTVPVATTAQANAFYCTYVDPTDAICTTTPPATSYWLPEIAAIPATAGVARVLLIEGQFIWTETSPGSGKFTSDDPFDTNTHTEAVLIVAYGVIEVTTEGSLPTPAIAAIAGIEVAYPIEAAKVSDADFTSLINDGNTWLGGNTYTRAETPFVGGQVVSDSADGLGPYGDGRYFTEISEGIWFEVDQSDPLTPLDPNSPELDGNGGYADLADSFYSANSNLADGIEFQAAEDIVVVEDGIRNAYADGFTGAGITISSMSGDSGDDKVAFDALTNSSISQVIIGGTSNLRTSLFTYQDFYGIARDATVDRFDKITDPATSADLATMVNWDNDIVHFGTASPLGDYTGDSNFQAITDGLNALNTDALIVITSGNNASDGGSAVGPTNPGTAFMRVLSGEEETIAFNGTDQVLIVGAYDFNESRTPWLTGDRFVMDSGFTHTSSDGTPNFSAAAASARVAGKSALLMQKFPGLDAAGIATRIINTADTTDTTFDHFEDNGGTYRGQIAYDKAIHGHGKVNLLNALSPQF